MTGIFLASDKLALLSSGALTEIFRAVGIPGVHFNGAVSSEASSATVSPGGYGIAELSVKQAREFVKGCSPKSLKVIEAMVAGNSRQFQIRVVAQALSVETTELTGVWSGLTRRVRTVTGEDDIYLIDWDRFPAQMEGDVYFDHRAELSEVTYKSFRKILNLS